MKFTIRLVLLGALLHSVAVPGHAELDVESYVELTIARLELVEEAWRENGQPPSDEDLEELYGSHGTDRESYLCFSGERRTAIEAFLEEHSHLRDEIESLSAAIRREIAQREE